MTVAALPVGLSLAIFVAPIVAPLVAPLTGRARAVDTVLVPLELPGDGWVARMRRALDHLEEGRYREGLEILQGVVDEGRIPSLPASRPATALVRVPAVLPRDFAALKGALLDTWVRDAPVDERSAPPRFPRRAIAVAVDPRTGRVVSVPPVDETPRSTPAPGRRFLPASAVASAVLAALPSEALSVYREIQEGEARWRLAAAIEARDPVLLERVADAYFATRTGSDAAEIAGDSAFERGDVRAALQWWRRVLADHPDCGAEGPARGSAGSRIRLKVLRALRRWGDAGGYALERARYLEGGGDVGALRPIEERMPLRPREDLPPPRTTSRWGGELWMARPPALPGAPLRLSWDSWLWSREGLPAIPRSASIGGRMLVDGRFVPFHVPLHFPFVPLVDGDSVFVSGVFSAYELSGRPGGGAILREFRKPSPRDVLGFEEDGDSHVYWTTLWWRERDGIAGGEGLPERVLVTGTVADRVRHVQYRGYDVTVKIPIRGLVAFDAATGRILWSTGPSGARRAGSDDVGASDVGSGDAAVGDAAAGDAAAGDAAAGDVGAGDVGAGGVGAGRAPGGSGLDDLDVDRLLAEDFDPEVELLRPWSPAGGPPGGGAIGGGQTAALKGFSTTSPAIVRRGLVVAGGWEQRGYVNVSLRALDLRTGEVVWDTPIVNSGQVERTLFGEMAREPFGGAIAEEGGVVYYVSQMGAVAAVDLASGRILWLSTYDSIPLEATLGRSAVPRNVVWGANPPLILGNVLVVTPRDSEYLYAFDTGGGPDGLRSGGRILWRVPNFPEASDTETPLRDVLGAWRGKLYLGGRAEIASLDLTSIDAYGIVRAGARIIAAPIRRRLASRTAFSMPAPGFLTTGGIVFADPQALRVLRLEGERLDGLAEPFRDPDDPGMRAYGRVQVVDGRVFVTSRQILSAFAPAPPRSPPP